MQELTVVKLSEETSFRKLQEKDEFVTIRDIAYIETEKQMSDDIESKSSAVDNKKRDTISLHIHRVKQLLLENPVPLNIFVTVSLDSEVKKSFKSIYNETVVFDFKCHFGVDGGSGETIIIKIFEGDRNEDSQCLGQFNLSIDEVKDKCILETWMPLSNTKSGDIQLSAQYKTIIYEPVAFTINVITTDVLCNGSNDGTAVVKIQGGSTTPAGTVSTLSYCASTPGSSSTSTLSKSAKS